VEKFAPLTAFNFVDEARYADQGIFRKVKMRAGCSIIGKEKTAPGWQICSRLDSRGAIEIILEAQFAALC
jgi:hypothetical protein